ncbi:unnamed protein product, partial [Brassica oleracea]
METRGLDFSTPLNSLEISLIELGELVNAREEEMREWTKALEKLESLHWKKKMEALDMIVTALEAYVEKVGEDSLEDSPQDVKEKEKKGNGVKRTHPLSYIMLGILYENVKTKVVVTNLLRKSHIKTRRHGKATTSIRHWKTTT